VLVSARRLAAAPKPTQNSECGKREIASNKNFKEVTNKPQEKNLRKNSKVYI
jgi:hypothetical protein